MYEEQQTVGDVDIAHAAVEIQREQMHVWMELLDATLEAFGYNMVGYAAKRLEADDMVDALLGQ